MAEELRGGEKNEAGEHDVQEVCDEEGRLRPTGDCGDASSGGSKATGETTGFACSVGDVEREKEEDGGGDTGGGEPRKGNGEDGEVVGGDVGVDEGVGEVDGSDGDVAGDDRAGDECPEGGRGTKGGIVGDGGEEEQVGGGCD